MSGQLRHTSVRRRLLLLLLSTVTLTWLLTALLSYFDAGREVDELLDAHLAQSAALLIAQVETVYEREDDEDEAHELFDDISEEHLQALHPYNRQVVFQIWQYGQRLRLHSANAPNEHLSSQENGFSETHSGGDHWRVFSAWDRAGLFLIQVGERHAVRDRIVFAIARRLLEPLLIALPMLALLIGFGIRRGLRPLTLLSNQIRQRRPDNLAPIAMTATPLEISPLVEGLNRLFERVQQSLENQRRFTADAAHELRTPLAAIKTQAQVARAASDAGERRHALEQVVAGCDRSAHLVEQLLTLARLEPDSPTHTLQPCDLRAIAVHVLTELASAALAKAIELELQSTTAATISGVPGLLTILLRNLIDNAIRYSPRSSRVTVELSRTIDQVLLSVTDQGPGLPAAERGKLGQRFYRVLGSGASGSGLGLSIVKRIVEIHQAELAFTSGEQNKGLQVQVSFHDG